PSLVLYGLDEGALTKLFAVLAAGVFIVLNYRGTKLTGRSETAVTIALVAIVISFIIAGLLYLTHAGVPAANFQPFLRGGSPPMQFVSLLGAMGFTIIVLGVTLGAIAALNSLIFSSSRVAFAMGRDGGLPRILGKLHARKRTPHVAIAVSGLIIVFITLTLDLNTVAASADVMFLLLFLMVNWAAIVLRRTMPDVKRYYLMPLFPLIPILGIATKFVLAISLWTIEPRAWVIALGWIGIGLTIHYLH